MFKTFIKILFFISQYFTITYKITMSGKTTDILLDGCSEVVLQPV